MYVSMYTYATMVVYLCPPKWHPCTLNITSLRKFGLNNMGHLGNHPSYMSITEG